MFYTVYRITNKLNNKIYIGTHKTNNLNDNYMSSSERLKQDIKKYGIENFNKDILFIYDNQLDMFNKEREIVNEEFLANENTYNLKVGGLGSWDYVNKNGFGILGSVRGGQATKEKSNNDALFKIKQIENGKKCSQIVKSKYPKGTFYNKKHSDETKRKISSAVSAAQSGDKNSQYGTRWIYNKHLQQNKKINKHDETPVGWENGRVMNWERYFNKFTNN